MRLGPAELKEREAAAAAHERSCRLCPRFCEIDRTSGARSPCLVGAEASLGGWGVHFGEEPELTGTGGCGLVLLAGCNLACAGCETHAFSREMKGIRKATAAELAGIVLELERRGAQTVQFVTPTHQLPVIVSALRRARDRGFSLPVVWNCGGYEAVEALRLLDGVVDVYLPDLKHGTDREGRLTGVSDYFSRTSEALREMYRQVGELRLDARGVATQGMIVRHLVLPDDAAASRPALELLASISPDLHVNVLGQFQPVYQLGGHARLGRRPLGAELDAVLRIAREAGLRRIYSDGRAIGSSG